MGDYGQCGGISGECSSTDHRNATLPPCQDGPWEGLNCNPGFLCARWDKWYWQCREVPQFVVPVAKGSGSIESDTKVPINAASYCQGPLA